MCANLASEIDKQVRLRTIHTVIALVAVGFGIAALWRHGGILLRNPWGRIYVIGTVLTCLTAFAIFRRGGFGIAPHWLD